MGEAQGKGLNSKKKLSVVLWLLLPLGALYALTIVNYWKPTSDSALYIVAAKSIVRGQGYSYQGFLTSPPPLFSLLLSPVIALLGYNFAAMRALIASTALGSALLVYLLLRPKTEPVITFAVTFLAACSFPVLFEITRILSDIPYMFFSLSALFFAGAYADEKKVLSWRGILTTVFITLACFTRQAGLALLLGVCGYFLLEGFVKGRLNFWSRKALFVLLVFSVAAGGWRLRNKSIPEQQRFVYEHVREKYQNTPPAIPLSLKFFVRNGKYYARLLAKTVMGPYLYIAGQPLLITLILLLGFSRCFFRQRGLFEYYVLIYAGTYLSFGGMQGERYLVPVIPFVFFYFFKGIKVLGGLITHIKVASFQKEKIKQCAIMIVILFLSYSHLRGDIVLIQREHSLPYYKNTVAEFMEIITWVRQNTAENAVIVSDRAPWVRLLSRRLSIDFPRTKDQQKILQSMLKRKAEYVVYSPVTGLSIKYLSPVLRDNREYFKRVYGVGNSAVFKVDGLKAQQKQ